MDNFKCFEHNEVINCKELCSDIKIYYHILYQFGLVLIFLSVLIIFLRYCINKYLYCTINNNTYPRVINNESNEQEVQCNIDIGVQCVVINPDQSLNISEKINY